MHSADPQRSHAAVQSWLADTACLFRSEMPDDWQRLSGLLLDIQTVQQGLMSK